MLDADLSTMRVSPACGTSGDLAGVWLDESPRTHSSAPVPIRSTRILHAVGPRWGTGLLYAQHDGPARRALESAIHDRDGRPCHNGYVCFYCGGVAHGIDHVTSRLHGGSDGVDNLVMCCWPCNEEKNTMPGWLFAARKCWDFVWPNLEAPYSERHRRPVSRAVALEAA